MTETWTEAQLANVPSRDGFRQRGVGMSRLETFTDAAFAFAVTLIVISVDDLPQSYDEFIDALKLVPAFLVCFVQLMLFWWAHHEWSRRFGLEQGWSMVLSLSLVATVLVYIFPLRIIFSAFFASATDGWLPSPFPLTLDQIGVMFVVFGTGFALMGGLVTALNAVALAKADQLSLNLLERHETRTTLIVWLIIALTGLISALIAVLSEFSPAAGFVYWSLAVTTPLATHLLNKRRP